MFFGMNITWPTTLEKSTEKDPTKACISCVPQCVSNAQRNKNKHPTCYVTTNARLNPCKIHESTPAISIFQNIFDMEEQQEEESIA